MFIVIRFFSSQYLLTVPVNGGQFSEGLVGYPRFINPVLAQNQSDKDLVALLFGSLYQNGEPELAASSTANEDSTEFTVQLRNNLRFHDGSPLTSDDVVFTFELITDPLVKSPLYPRFIGVQAEAIDERTIRFSLSNGNEDFIQQLDFGILSFAEWSDVPLEEFPFSIKNISPVGSGPYQLSSITRNSREQINSLVVSKFNDSFYKPYIDAITFRFYDDELSALEAFESRDINNLSNISAQELLSLDRTLTETEITTVTLPRIFGLFFNLSETEILGPETRRVISDAIDRQNIINTVFFRRALVADGPIVPFSDNYQEAAASSSSDIQSRLTAAGWRQSSSSDILVNEAGEALAFELSVPESKELIQTANLISEQLDQYGIEVTVNTIPEDEFANRIVRRRNFETILFGQIVDSPQQLYAFWHSSQRTDPGVNITGYENKTVDSILERILEETSPNAADYENFQKQIRTDSPVIFLYSPQFIYALDRDILQVNLTGLERAEDRFDSIETWYIRTESLLPWFTIN